MSEMKIQIANGLQDASGVLGQQGPLRGRQSGEFSGTRAETAASGAVQEADAEQSKQPEREPAQRQLSVFYTNANGLFNKLDKLKSILYENSFDIYSVHNRNTFLCRYV